MKTRVFAVCMVVFLFCGITHAGLSDGLVAYYPFNGNASDESGNGNNGTAYRATLTTDRFGKINSAYSFNGLNNYIQINKSDTLDITTSFTLSVWVKINAFNHGGIISYGPNEEWDDYETYSLNAFPSPNHIVLQGNWPNTQVLESQTLLSLQTWYHISATFQKGTAKIFINGLIDQTNQWKINTLSLAVRRVLRIGENQPGAPEFFNGIIDDLRIYNRALSDSEIQQLYNEGQVCPGVAVKPYTFTTGTPAKAAEVNADFDTLYQQINTQNCQIQTLNSQLQALKAIVCKNDPTASVCQ